MKGKLGKCDVGHTNFKIKSFNILINMKRSADVRKQVMWMVPSSPINKRSDPALTFQTKDKYAWIRPIPT